MSTDRGPDRLRRDRRAATVAAGAIIVLYGLFVPKGGRYEIDHRGGLETLARMRAGEGFYQAFRNTYLSFGVRLGGPRSFRTPYLFLLLREVPPSLLYPTFLVAVVGVTSYLLIRCTDHPLVALPVTVFLLVAGRTLGGARSGIEGWMLVELWTVPLLAASTWAWKREKWWIAALTAAGAVLIRELALPVLLVGLVVAWRTDKPKAPWLTGLAVAALGWTIHVILAMQFGVAHGNEAKLFDTAKPPYSILKMMAFPASDPLLIWLFAGVWVIALAGLAEVPSRLAPVSSLLAIPLLGLFVSRSYWGLPIIPFVVFWASEEVVRLAIGVKASRAKRAFEGKSLQVPGSVRPRLGLLGRAATVGN